ncbi:deleted in malignant brain tumors 1 protein-like [Heptranchias perlo]|uniref:deleted in malignant brain tumors 1 protein-like n=1 Tax=Heptranchias perlo TaxID=212740 RepID=UPI00355AC1D9
MRIQSVCEETVKLRLVNGGSPCAGTVEILYKGQWGTVDHNLWDQPDAAVVCRELGCGAALSAPGGAHFGKGSGRIVTYGVRCGGTEAALRDCVSASWRHRSWPHSTDAGVICSDHRELRLVSGSSRCSGRVEVLHGDQWGTVCDIYFGLEDAGVVCEHLQCGTVIVTPGEAHFGEGTGPVWKENYKCRGNESRLWDCPVSSWEQFNCSHGKHASVICSGQQLRLVGGRTNCSGRVEIMFNNTWGTVCDDSWDRREARVVCRQLDCGSALSDSGEPVYGKGEGPVLLSRVQCKGSELFLWDCRSSTWAQRVCAHKVASVMCSGRSRNMFIQSMDAFIYSFPCFR